jgi:RNA polymerase sigma factor (sigma-70 family)
MRQQVAHDLLDRQAERKLLQAAKRGSQAAIDELVKHNQRLVFDIARRYYATGWSGDQEISDLMQWGNLGLLAAIKKWDGRDLKFSTYATYWIQAYIRRYSPKCGYSFGMSFGDWSRMGEIRKSRKRLTEELNRKPTLEEIADDTSVSTDAVLFSTDLVDNVVSLDYDGDCQNPTLAPFYERIPDPKQDIERQSYPNLFKIQKGLESLNERERYVIEHRYELNGSDFQTYKQIGRKFGISSTSIRKLEARALEKLKAYI